MVDQNQAAHNSDNETEFISDDSKDVKQDLLAEYSEVILDSLSDGSFFDEIPLVKTGVSAWRLVQAAQEKRFHRRLAIFLEEVRDQRAQRKQVEEIEEKMQTDKDYRERVLEHVLIQLERLDDERKSKILARLFLSLLREQIKWKVFLDLCSSLERSHIIVFDCLENQSSATIGMVRIDQRNRHSATGIRSTVQEALLLEASGLGFRPQKASSQEVNAILSDLGRELFVFGIHIKPS